MSQEVSTEQSYRQLLVALKQQVQSAQVKAALAVNSSLIQLYWNMGKMIAENQALFEGRNNYVEQLAKDLRAEFPEMKGFSRSKLFYIRKFYQFYAIPSVQQLVGLEIEAQDLDSGQQPVALKSDPSVQQAVRLSAVLASVPWGHHVLLINRLVARGIIEGSKRPFFPPR